MNVNSESEKYLSERFDQLNKWLDQVLGGDFNLTDLAADAGARRYLRLYQNDKPSLVVMDAPPQWNDVQQFCDIAKLLHQHELHVPRILHQNLERGFLLLNDLGDDTYLKILNQQNANVLFDQATTALVTMQRQVPVDNLLIYGESSMRSELELFENWYLSQHLELQLAESMSKSLKATLDSICHRCASQPTVFTHRDYMPRNLMVCDPTPGILDFQDAQSGPVTYDIISLFKDAFLSWEEEQVLDWSIRYWEKARSAKLPVREDFGVFFEEMEWMGLQRHLKVLGVFSRLKYRDQKPHYLEDESRFLGYIRATANRYDALAPLLHVLDLIEGVERKTQHTF
jgi:aminoglycoside/choline kinase family phosphotransferase